MAASHSNRNSTIVIPGFVPLDTSLPDSRVDDLAGRDFGGLHVMRYAGRRHVAHGTLMYWICRCHCGRMTLACSTHLKRFPPPKGCGCDISKRNWKRKNVNIRHHPLYNIWNGIVGRTRNHLAYILRGMCDGFLDFDHFVAVIGERPSADHSVDRKDNDGGYWCGNCDQCRSLGRPKNVRWATKHQQANNKRNNRRITYDGETRTLAEWAIHLGASRARLWARLRLGWTVEETFRYAKLGNKHSKNPIHREPLLRERCAFEYSAGATLSDLAVAYGCDRHTIAKLLRSLGVSLRNRSDWMKAGLAKRRSRRRNGQRRLFE